MAQKKKHTHGFDHTVYLFQGGGALGAYQVGVYKALSKQGYLPDWVIGTSIGAINSAIIAGNKPEKRVKKLEHFWETIATKMLPPPKTTLNDVLIERAHHMLSADYTTWVGQPNFFKLRPISPWLSMQSSADQLSYYDNTELWSTLPKFIDFDLLNEKKVRLSIGAVRVETGELVYFDNTKIEIKLEHVMASSALPPGFPAVCINNQYYWDAGVHSNTQVNLLLCEREPKRYLCFMVQLFDSYGVKPTNMDDILKRQKDIIYSSHHKEMIQVYRTIHNLKHAISLLGQKIPKNKKQEPEVKKFLELGRTGIIHLVRFHYQGKPSDLSSKDFEFSISSLLEHMKNGCEDVGRALQNPPWEKDCPKHMGLVLYEVTEHPVVDNDPYEEVTNYYRIT